MCGKIGRYKIIKIFDHQAKKTHKIKNHAFCTHDTYAYDKYYM